MKRYNEVTIRHMMIGDREFQKGSIVRVVAISEKQAAIMNEMKNELGLEYVLEEVKNEDTIDDLSNKEVRAALIARATELGLEFAKNISLANLQKLVDDNTPAN